jgi:penicillin-binding protein 1C
MKRSWHKAWTGRFRARWWLGLPAALLLGILLVPLNNPLFRNEYATVLESADGRLLGAAIAADEQWRFPLPDSVPYKFRQCLLLYEDEHFYRHPGINPVSMLRALRQNFRAGRVVSGGSTLSMQVARLSRHNPPRSYFDKVYEILLALKLELRYSKEEILRLYAAHAPFGGNVAGLGAASWRYFGRPPEQLSWGEAAALAVLPNSPALVYPGRNSEKLLMKRNALLDKLGRRGLMDSASVALAKTEPLPGAPVALPRLAPHLLARSIGEGHRGRRVRSSIDYDLQRSVAAKVARHHRWMAANEVHNAAALVIDIASGRALAYVGNVDSDGDHSQHSDLVNARRSTGSLLKPLLYAAALDGGLILPGQLLPDIPVFYEGFAPRNFDKKYYGAVPAHEALSRSLNVPYVFLLREYGYERFHQKLRNLGYASMDHPAAHYGLSMILGGSESTLWDLTALFSGTVRSLQEYNRRKGVERYPAGTYRASTYLAGPIPDYKKTTGEGELDAGAIWLMLRALQALERPDELNDWEKFTSSRPIAWKTGTSFGFRDAWAIGMNAQYAVGVWIGNADGEGRPGLTGIRAAAPLMFDIFDLLGGESHFQKPVAALRTLTVCARSGYMAGPDCTETREADIPAGVLHTPVCPFHQHLHLDASGSFRVNSACYPVHAMIGRSHFVLPPVQAWYYRQYHPDYTEPPDFLPECASAVRNDQFELIYPGRFTRIFVPRELGGEEGRAVFEAAHRDPQAALFWYIDEQYIGTTRRFHQIGVRPPAGRHTLAVYDQQGRETKVAFEVLSR